MLDSVRDSFEFRLETILLNLTDQICKRMQEKGMTRKELAQILEVSPAAVTKILNGNSNFTIRTLLSLADALDSNLNIELPGREVSQCQEVVQFVTASATYYKSEIFENTDSTTFSKLSNLRSAEPSYVN